MSGIEIQYLLGLYFTISAIDFAGGTFTASFWKLIAGLILLIAAIMHVSPLR